VSRLPRLLPAPRLVVGLCDPDALVRVWVAPGVYSPPLRRSEAAGLPWGEIVQMAMREAA
jgi:hypothetical protein